jgi:hypothetical protein
MQLTIGSNHLRSTDGIINIRGKRQIALEWGPMGSELLLTMDLYGVGGAHVASGFHLVDTKSSQVVLAARVVGKDSVVITQGAFYSFAGHKIKITVEDWSGVTESETPTGLATQSTNAPYAADEIASIGKAVSSSLKTVACPRCGCPLTRERLASEAQRDRWLVSCLICGRNLVVHGQP